MMGAFPTGSLTKVQLDQGTDSPATARLELLALVDKLNAIIASYAAISGLCELDATGKIPAARLPSGAGTGTDADYLDGQHGAYYLSSSNQNAGTLPAARFADSSHGNRSGGALHAVATQAAAGFMSAADKQALDGQVTNMLSAFSPVAGSNFQLFDLPDMTTSLTTETSVFTKKTYVGFSGTFRVQATMHTTLSIVTAYLSIYKNGVLNTSLTVTGTTPTLRTVDISLVSGDTIEMRIRISSSSHTATFSGMGIFVAALGNLVASFVAVP